MSRPLRALAYGLFFASGATALVYQVVWVRELTLIFGASFEAVSIVLASFMGGLALGGLAFGRAVERIARPLRLYGALEIAVAVFALLLPWLLAGLTQIYVGLAREFGEAGLLLNGARVAMAFLILVLPTFFMGGTLPVLTRFLVRSYSELAERLAGLYAVNTFGAVAGALLAGFVLLRFFGVWNTTLIAVTGNLVIGAVALGVDRYATRDTDEDAPEPEATAADEVAHPLALRLAFWGTAAAGAGALALEVMWSRAISVAIGSTTYSYSIMLAAFLVGIALGSGAHALLPLKRIGVAVQFGVTMVVIGLATTAVSSLMPRLPELALRLNVALYGGFQGVRAWTTLLLSFGVMLGPCVFMGVAFPLAGQARALLRERYGESVGDLVALNTLGAILGALGAGFFLIPQVGLQRGMGIASALYLGYGLLVLSARSAARGRRMWGAAGAAASVAVALALPWLTPRWDPRMLAAFQNNKAHLAVDDAGHIDMSRWLARTHLLYYAEGRGSNVSVIDQAGHRNLLINGKSVASDTADDMQHEYLLGHLPTLLHPDPRSAVVIGLGAGLTLGGVAADQGLERIVLVEIEPVVVGGARLFADLTDDALDDPRLEVWFQDGRNFLLTSRETFDVITADPIHPWAQGAVYLYTREYYDLLAERLSPGGIMCQWLPLYELSEENLRSVIGTFAGSFAHVTIWQATGDLVLIGSDQPLRVDLDNLQRRLEQPVVRRQLSRIGLDEAHSFLAEFTLDDPAVRSFADGAIVNTDDNLYLEFSSPLTIGQTVVTENVLLFDRQRESASVVVQDGAAAEVLARYAAGKSADIRAGLELDAAIARARPEYFAVAAQTADDALAATPDYAPLRQTLASIYTSSGLERRRGGSEAEAYPMFVAALAIDPGHPTANLRVGIHLMKLDRFAEAVPYLRRALARRPWFPDAEGNLGIALAETGDHAAALPHLAAAARMRPQLALSHEMQARSLRALGRDREADAALARARALRP